MKEKKGMDYTLLFLVLILVAVGLAILYSTSAYNGQVKFQDSFYYLKKQVFAVILGIMMMVIVAKIDYHMWENVACIGYVLSIILSVAVIFFGSEYNGSKRWLSLGPFSFQPSEFSKVVLIIFLAWLVCRNAKQIEKWHVLLKILVPVLPVVGLVGMANLSTAIIILGIGGILIFIASPRYLQFVIIASVGVGFLGIFLALESYRLERIAIWRNPELYEKGYQTLQGLYAIGSGGIFGNGFGNSIQKRGFVPEAQNDMIFSIICEEFGIVGACLIITLFMLLIYRFFLIAINCKDLFGTLIVTGVMVHISLQVLLNIAVVTNTIPNTGITLPFISYGGTSVMFLMIEMGLVLSVSNLIQ